MATGQLRQQEQKIRQKEATGEYQESEKSILYGQGIDERSQNFHGCLWIHREIGTEIRLIRIANNQRHSVYWAFHSCKL